MALIAAIFALILGCFAYILWPERNPFVQADKTRVDYLSERKEAIYENLRDLNFEFKAGKYPQEDFEVQRTLLEQETATLLAEIDHLEQA
jgi:hypothetical protein